MIRLLARLHFERQATSALDDATPAFVERVLRVNEIAMIREKPIDTIRCSGFFVGGQQQKNVLVGHVAFALQPDDRGRPDGRIIFVVGGSASVKPSVALEKCKG